MAGSHPPRAVRASISGPGGGVFGSVYLVVVGCSETVTTPDAGSAPPEATPVVAAQPAPTLSGAESRTLQQAFIAHLDDGRKAAHVGQFEEALVSLQTAQAMSPGSAQLSAEVSWAAFKTGETILAEASGLRAVRLSEHRPGTQASSLYQLGRIAESQDRLQEAARYYAQALQLRPSLHVEASLSALRNQGFTAEPADPACALEAHSGTVEELCALSASSWSTTQRTPAACQLSGDREGQTRRVALTTGGEAVIFAFQSDGTAHYTLAVGSGESWQHVSLGQVYNPGALGTEGTLQVQLEERELSSQPGTELLVTVSTAQTLLDISIDELDTLDAERTLVLGGLDAEPVLLMDRRTAEQYSRERMGLASDDERSVGYFTSELPIRREWRSSVTFNGAGGVTLLREDGVASVPVALGSDALLCGKD